MHGKVHDGCREKSSDGPVSHGSPMRFARRKHAARLLRLLSLVQVTCLPAQHKPGARVNVQCSGVTLHMVLRMAAWLLRLGLLGLATWNCQTRMLPLPVADTDVLKRPQMLQARVLFILPSVLKKKQPLPKLCFFHTFSLGVLPRHFSSTESFSVILSQGPSFKSFGGGVFHRR